MTDSRHVIETSYAACRQMSARAGSNFHIGFLLLPRAKRRAMEALYAFMRHTDDLADDLPSDLPRREALSAWRAELVRALSAECGRNEEQESPVPRPLSSAPRLLPALADAVRRFDIPHEHLYAVIDGVEMDIDRRQYETFDQLQVYCQRVASAVGLACIHIWGFRGPEAFEPARQAGIALQLTNILRDLKEDAEAGRVYLPLADLRQCDYAPHELIAGVADERFHRLMSLEIARAEQFYAAGSELLDWLSPSGRRIFGLMMGTYRSLLRKIASHPAEVFRRHVRLSSPERARLVLRWTLLPPRKAALQ